MKRSKQLASGTIAVVLMVGALLVGPATAGTAPYCGLTWGSQPKRVGHGPAYPPSSLTNVRAGRHTCYDRLVMDLGGPAVGYHVGYVSAVTDQGSGQVVPLRGGAFLDVTLYAPTYDLDGTPTFNPRDKANVVAVGGFGTFRQVASGGSFEGDTTFGLGVRARLPFRVFVVRGPGSTSRLVVDVSHRW